MQEELYNNLVEWDSQKHLVRLKGSCLELLPLCKGLCCTIF